MIKTHTLNEMEYYPYGNGIESDKGNSGMNFVERFFSRKSGQTGLSVAIPYCSIEIDEIKKSCIKQCYMPIFNEKLVFEINGETIDKNALLEADNSIVKMLMEHETSHPEPVERHIPVKSWKQDIGNDIPKLKEEIRKKAEGQNTLFSIKLTLDLPISKVAGRKQEKGIIETRVEKRKDEQGGELDVWRNDVLVSEACGKNAYHKGFSVLVLIEGEKNSLGGILRKLEDPGHRKWPSSTLPDEVKKEYKIGDIKSLVRFVTKLPQTIVESIRITPSNLDSGFFSDYFPDITRGGERKGGGSEGDNTTLEIPHSNQDFKYTSITGGFKLKLNPNKENFPKTAVVKVAYGTTDGDPFKKYRKGRFHFQKRHRHKG